MFSIIKNIYEKPMWYACLLYLIILFSGKLAVLYTSVPTLHQIIGIVGILIILLPLLNKYFQRYLLFAFGCGIPLFGSAPYSLHSFFFELFLCVIAVVIIVNSERKYLMGGRNFVFPLLVTFLLLACFSLLLLPVHEFFEKMILWNPGVFWAAVSFATPEDPLYSFRSVNSLFLYCFFITVLASFTDGKALFKNLFIGFLFGAFWSALVGIMGYYGLIDLEWFRVTAGRGTRLQSVFANPGWFAEFLAITIPYILLFFATKKIQRIYKLFLFGMLIICEIAIFLTYSRTGWLLYPLILCVCWFLFYIAHQTHTGKYTWSYIGKLVAKISLSVPLTIIVSYFVLFSLLPNLQPADSNEKAKFEKRVSQLTNPITRKAIWKDSVATIQENPVWGGGYESYKFHTSFFKKDGKQWDTPHNLYLQLLVSGGIVGLMLWGLLVFYSMYLLVVDLVRNKSYFNIAVLLSIIAFHFYGLAQSMQYIPVIWFLIFLNIGYSMTIDKSAEPKWIHKHRPLLNYLLLLVVVCGLIAYASNFQSYKTAAALQLTHYSPEQEPERYRGFYPPEQWENMGVFRWTGSTATIKIGTPKIVEFTFVCSAPDLTSNPLFLSVYEEKRLIDRVAFSIPESKTRKYYLPVRQGTTKKQLRFSVSRTWNLRKLGLAVI